MKKRIFVAVVAVTAFSVIVAFAIRIFLSQSGCSIQETTQEPFHRPTWQRGENRISFANSLIARLQGLKRAEVDALIGVPFYDGMQEGSYLTYVLLDKQWPNCGPISSRILMDVRFDSAGVVSRVTTRND